MKSAILAVALLLGSSSFASYGTKTVSSDNVDSTFAFIIEYFQELRAENGALTTDLKALTDDLQAKGGAELAEPEVSDVWRIESGRSGPSHGSTYLLPLWAGYKSNSWIAKYLKITVESDDATNTTTIVIDKFVDVTIGE